MDRPVCVNCSEPFENQDPAVCVGCYELLAKQVREPGRSYWAERDRLAAMAMQGMLADESGGERGYYEPYEPQQLAIRAYRFADAMLAEREKKVAGHAGK